VGSSQGKPSEAKGKSNADLMKVYPHSIFWKTASRRCHPRSQHHGECCQLVRRGHKNWAAGMRS